jgi:hypothetical protein
MINTKKDELNGWKLAKLVISSRAQNMFEKIEDNLCGNHFNGRWPEFRVPLMSIDLATEEIVFDYNEIYLA